MSFMRKAAAISNYRGKTKLTCLNAFSSESRFCSEALAVDAEATRTKRIFLKLIKNKDPT